MKTIPVRSGQGFEKKSTNITQKKHQQLYVNGYIGMKINSNKFF
jgi:hypothetical protein